MSYEFLEWHDAQIVVASNINANPPVGWTAGWNNTAAWARLPDYVRFSTATSNWAKLALDSAGSSITDCETAVKLRYTNAGSSTEIYGGCAVRAGGTASTKDGYIAILWRESSSSKLLVLKFVGNSQTNLANVTKTHTIDTDYIVRLQAVGTAIKAKFWAASGAEPGAWDYEGTDSDLSAGDISLITYSNDNEVRFSSIGLSTDPASDSAPIEPLTASVTLTGFPANESGIAIDVSVDRDSPPFYSATGQSANGSGELAIAATGCPLATGTRTVWIRCTNSDGLAGGVSNNSRAFYSPVEVTVS